MTTVGIVTVSDTRSHGARADTTTPLIRQMVEDAGWTVQECALVPDEREQIQRRLIDFTDRL